MTTIGKNNGSSGKGFGTDLKKGGPGGVPNEDIGAVIAKAADDRKVTGGEATEIIKAAVTPGAREQVAELFDRTPREIFPGQMVTMAMPENPNDVVFTGAAVNRLNVFFTQFDLPAGQNLVNKIESRLASLDLGAPISPPDASALRAVTLPSPELPNRIAYFNKVTSEFYVEISGGSERPNPANTFWYGPFSLIEGVAPAITEPSAERTAQLMTALKDLRSGGDIRWTPGPVARPAGAAFGELVLVAKTSDDFTYSAVIPLGALTATGPEKDINTVSEFYLERRGGVSGQTVSSPLFSLPEAVAQPTTKGSRLPNPAQAQAAFDRLNLDTAVWRTGPALHPETSHIPFEVTNSKNDPDQTFQYTVVVALDRPDGPKEFYVQAQYGDFRPRNSGPYPLDGNEAVPTTGISPGLEVPVVALSPQRAAQLQDAMALLDTGKTKNDRIFWPGLTWHGDNDALPEGAKFATLDYETGRNTSGLIYRMFIPLGPDNNPNDVTKVYLGIIADALGLYVSAGPLEVPLSA